MPGGCDGAARARVAAGLLLVSTMFLQELLQRNTTNLRVAKRMNLPAMLLDAARPLSLLFIDRLVAPALDEDRMAPLIEATINLM